MGPKSSPILSDECHSQDLVHGIGPGEKPSSTDCVSPCRANSQKEKSNEVAGRLIVVAFIGSRVRHVAFAVTISD